MSKWSREAIHAVAVLAAWSNGYPKLLPEQKQVITSFVKGRDVFVSLPTGYKKTLCFAALPGTYDCLWDNEGNSIVVVLSPLIALMEEQVAFLKERGLSAASVSPGEDEKSVGMELHHIILVTIERGALLLYQVWHFYASTSTRLVTDE